MCIRDRLQTLAEEGYPAFDMTAWFSFVAPKGTPAPVLAKLQAALTETLQDEAVKKRMLDMGIDPRSGTAAELDKQVKTEQPIVSQLIKQANIVLQ